MFDFALVKPNVYIAGRQDARDGERLEHYT